jgi:hypothetical protein
MARSYSIVGSAAVGSASYHQLAIYAATAAGIRPKIYEFGIASSATPADQASRLCMVRSTTGAPTGGSNPTAAPLDMADPAALATTYLSATGGETMSTQLMIVSVNQRATYRWVAAPGKEFVLPNTQYAGLGLQSLAQSASYNLDLSLFWEE